MRIFKLSADMIQTAAVLLLIAAILFPSLSYELTRYKDASYGKSGIANQVSGVPAEGSLNVMEGNHLWGMVPLALRGEFILVVDGIQISEGMSIENINFSGLRGQKYSIETQWVPELKTDLILATLIGSD